MLHRNHEGYNDPTAGLALEGVSRKARYRQKKAHRFERLTFRIGELSSFNEWVELNRQRG